MDLCRGTQEVEAVLSESDEETGAYDPLDRLKMAINYEEKKADYARSTSTSSSSIQLVALS